MTTQTARPRRRPRPQRGRVAPFQRPPVRPPRSTPSSSTGCEDATYEAALPVAGLPAVITGHEALHAAFTGLVAAARSIEVHDVRIHQTDDPDVA